MPEKKVTRDGKKNTMIRQQERNAFDKLMNSAFSGVSLLSEHCIRNAMSFDGFNIRRLAHWVKKHHKKVVKDAMGWLNNMFGTLGGLNPKQHFI